MPDKKDKQLAVLKRLLSSCRGTEEKKEIRKLIRKRLEQLANE